MLKKFRVSPILIRSTPVVSPFRLDVLTPSEKEYLENRGGFDEWWMRVRAPGPKAGPSLDTTDLVRGYVEVEL